MSEYEEFGYGIIGLEFKFLGRSADDDSSSQAPCAFITINGKFEVESQLNQVSMIVILYLLHFLVRNNPSIVAQDAVNFILNDNIVQRISWGTKKIDLKMV
jgi:hypothetical protein